MIRLTNVIRVACFIGLSIFCLHSSCYLLPVTWPRYSDYCCSSRERVSKITFGSGLRMNAWIRRWSHKPTHYLQLESLEAYRDFLLEKNFDVQTPIIRPAKKWLYVSCWWPNNTQAIQSKICGPTVCLLYCVTVNMLCFLLKGCSL
jgi:hypothetical protein